MARLEFQSMISRSEVVHVNHYSIITLLENDKSIYNLTYIVMRQKVSLGLSKFL